MDKELQRVLLSAAVSALVYALVTRIAAQRASNTLSAGLAVLPPTPTPTTTAPPARRWKA